MTFACEFMAPYTRRSYDMQLRDRTVTPNSTATPFKEMPSIDDAEL